MSEAQPTFIRDLGRSWENQGDDASYSIDMAGEVDSLEDWMREEWLVSERQARLIIAWHRAQVVREAAEEKSHQLGRVLGLLMKDGINLRVMVHALALAMGLDELNGAHSQAEVARKLGCSRALISHYVIDWAELIGVHILKFRKNNSTRETFSARTKEAWAKRHGVTFPKPTPKKP